MMKVMIKQMIILKIGDLFFAFLPFGSFAFLWWFAPGSGIFAEHIGSVKSLDDSTVEMFCF